MPSTVALASLFSPQSTLNLPNHIDPAEFNAARLEVDGADPVLLDAARDLIWDYQKHLEAWDAYVEEVVFNRGTRSVLPRAAEFFDMDSRTRRSLIQRMQPELISAAGNGEDLSDPDVRQAIFTDSLMRELEEQFVQGDAARQKIWDALCVVDEADYHTA